MDNGAGDRFWMHVRPSTFVAFITIFIFFFHRDWFLADKMSAKGVNNVFAFRYVRFEARHSTWIVFTHLDSRWNAPDAVLFAAEPFEGVMHTSDLYFLFDGKGLFDFSKPD